MCVCLNVLDVLGRDVRGFLAAGWRVIGLMVALLALIGPFFCVLFVFYGGRSLIIILSVWMIMGNYKLLSYKVIMFIMFIDEYEY